MTISKVSAVNASSSETSFSAVPRIHSPDSPDQQWGQVILTDESCLAILDVYTYGRSGEHEITPPTSLKKTCLGVAELLFREVSCLLAALSSHLRWRFSQWCPLLYRGSRTSSFQKCYGYSVHPYGRQRKNSSCSGCRRDWILLESENIQGINWLAIFLFLNPIEHSWMMLGSMSAATSNYCGTEIGATKWIGSDPSTGHWQSCTQRG